MLTYPTLRFPEGTAIGNVLKASASGRTTMRQMLQGGLVGAVISLLEGGFKIFADSLQIWISSNKILFGLGLGFSPALLGAGFIIGMQACVGMLVGLVTAWIVGMPILTHLYGLPAASSHYDMAMTMRSEHIRYIGVGVMLLGGLWTLIILVKPIIKSISTSFRSLRTVGDQKMSMASIPRTERDIPITYVAWGTLVLAVAAFFLFLHFLNLEAFEISAGLHYGIIVFAVLYLLLAGFCIASVCAYLSGLVGMTNNPLSGLMLGSILLSSLILLPIFSAKLNVEPGAVKAATSIVIIITTVVAVVVTISGENLQDLKAGQMVGATPWKQQIMLLVGVTVSALVVAPVLELLFQAYGMAGVFPRSGMDPSQMLPAPQAGLMAAVAQGVFGHSLPWTDISIGIVMAFIAIIIDENLKKRDLRLPVLAIGIGVYLPPEITSIVVVGGIINYVCKRVILRKGIKPNQPQFAQAFEDGTLLACGLVAGAALMGVILAIPFVLKGSSDALRLVPESFTPVADILGLAVTISLCIWLYKTTMRAVKPS